MKLEKLQDIIEPFVQFLAWFLLFLFIILAFYNKIDTL